MERRASLGLLLGLLGVTLFGATVPATRYAVRALDPFFLTFARASLAGIAAAGILLARRSPVPWRHGLALRDFVIVALCLVAGFPLLMAMGSVTVPSAHAGIVLGIMPLTTTLAATMLAGERPSAGFVALSVLGCALVVGFALRNGGAGDLGPGDGLLGLAAIVCSVGYAVSGKLSRSLSGWEVICWALVLALPVSLVVTLALMPKDLAAVPAGAWLGLGYVALVSQLVAFFFWNAGLALGGIARIGQLQLLQTFLIVVLSWPINGEAPDMETYVFMAAVMAVVALGQRAKVRTAPA